MPTNRPAKPPQHWTTTAHQEDANVAPRELHNVLEKCRALNSGPVWLCERGTLWLPMVVDPLAFAQLKRLGAPVTSDVTHLQQPGALGSAQGEEEKRVGHWLGWNFPGHCRSVHRNPPQPSRARCDGACALAE